MAKNNEFIVEVGAKLNKAQVKAMFEDLKKEIHSKDDITSIKIKVDTSNNKIKETARELQTLLQKEFKSMDVNLFSTAVKDLTNFEKRIGLLSNKLKNSGLNELTSDFNALETSLNRIVAGYHNLSNISDDNERWKEFERLKNSANGAEVKLDKLIKTERQHKAETAEAEKALAKYANELSKLNQLEVQLEKAKQKSRTTTNKADVASMNAYVKELEKSIAMQREQVDIAGKNATAIAGADKAAKTYEQSQRKLKTTLAGVNVTQEQQVGLLGNIQSGFKDAISNLSGYALAFGTVQLAIQQIRQSIDTIIELDKAMVDLQIVTNSTREEIHNLLQEYNQMAISMGRSTKTVAESANEFLRMGYDVKDSNELIKQSLTLATLGMIEAGDATDYMISAMKGYGVEVENVSNIIDMATELDMKYSISSGYIMEAMSRTAASAKLAGSEMSNLMAMISIVGETTKKAPEVVGEAMKTMYARFGNVKINKFEDSDNPDEVEGINDIERVLNRLGIAIRTTGGEWRNYDEVMNEVGQRFNELSDLEQNAIATAMFGTRQRENGIVILTNWNRVLEANEIALGASGTAEERMKYYTEGLGAALERVGAAWERFLISLGDNDKVIWLVNAFADLIETLSNPVIQNLLFSTVAVVGINKIFTALGNISLRITSISKGVSFFYQALDKGSTKTDALTAGIKKYSNSMGAAGLVTKETSKAMAEQADVSAKHAIALGKMGLAIAAITVVVSVISALNNAHKESIKTAAELSEETKKEVESLESLKNEIIDLRGELKKVNLTTEETLNIRGRLSDIQDDLINNYEIEKNSIDLVNGSLETNIALLEQQARLKSAEGYNENLDEFEEALDWMNGKVSYKNKMFGKFGLFGDAGSTFSASRYADTDELLIDIYQAANRAGLSFDKGVFAEGMTRQDAVVALEKFHSELSKLTLEKEDLLKNEKFNAIFDDIKMYSDWIKGDSENWEKFEQLIDSQTSNALASRYTKEVNAINEAKKAYEEAIASGDKDVIDSARSNIISAIDDLGKEGKKKGEDFIYNYAEGLKEGYVESEVNKFKDSLLTGQHSWIGEAIKSDINVDENGNKIADTVQRLGKEAGLTDDEIRAVVTEITNMGKASKDGSDRVGELTNILSKLSSAYSSYDTLTVLIDDITETGRISKEQIEQLISLYPDLANELIEYTTGLKDEQYILDILKKKRQSTEQTYRTEILKTFTTTKEYRQKMYTDNQSVFESLGIMYKADTDTFVFLQNEKAKAAAKAAGVTLEAWSAANLNLGFLTAPYMNKENKGKMDTVYTTPEGKHYYEYLNPNSRYAEPTELTEAQWQMRLRYEENAKKIQELHDDLFKESNNSKTESNNDDPWKDAFENEYNDLKHRLTMDYITEKEYYDKLEKLNNKYFKDKDDYLEDYHKYEEEVYKGRKSLWKDAFDEELDALDRMHEQGIINDKQYLEEFTKLNDKYFKDNPLYKEEDLKNQDKIFELTEDAIKAEYEDWIAMHDDYVDEMDYYNKWSLQQKLNYLAEESAMMEKIYGNNETIYEEYVNRQIELRRRMYDVTKEMLEEEVDKHDAYLEYVNDVIDKKVKDLEESKEAIEEENDAREEAIRLAELEKRLAEAKRKKVLIYRKGQGFVYEQDQTAVNEAQKELDDYLYEREKEKRIEAIQDEIDAWEEYRDEWNRTVEAYNEEQNRLTALMYDGYASEKEILEMRRDLIDKYAESYAKAANKVAEANKLINSNTYDMEYDPETGEFTSTINGDRYTGSYGSLYDEVQRTQKEIGTSGDTWAILPSGQKVKVNLNDQNKVTDSLPVGTTIVNQTGGWTITGGSAGAYEATEVKKPSTSSGGSKNSSSSSSKGSSSGGYKNTGVDIPTHTYDGKEISKETQQLVKDLIDMGYAGGTTGTNSDEIAMVGEEGRELKVLPKGTGIIPNPATETLMKFANNPASFINSLSTPSVATLSNSGYTEVFNVSGITVNANNADEFINTKRTLKNKAIQRTSKRN